MTRFARLIPLLLVALTLGLAACGGDDEESATTPAPTAGETGGGGGASTLELATPSGVEYDKTSLEAAAGEVTIDYTNDSGLQHNTSLTVDLEAGEYTFYCSVDGHRDAGMEGTLVVD